MGQAQTISLWNSRELPEERTFRESIQYNGRKTARVKSEHRRLQILEATLAIAAREGLRGIKHRAVAKEAKVPLAATTYYFRDIGELISDAFMLFAERARAELGCFYDTVNLVLDNMPPESLVRGGPGRQALATRLSAISTAYLNQQFSQRREQVLAEQVFLMEALRDEQLAELARTYRGVWVAGLEQILQRLDSHTPARDASLLVSVVLGLGYDHMLNQRAATPEALEEAVQRIIGLVLAA